MPDVVEEAEKAINPKLTPNVLSKLKAMKAEVQKADTLLSAYMSGVLDGMGLEGAFSVDENTGQLSPLKTETENATEKPTGA